MFTKFFGWRKRRAFNSTIAFALDCNCHSHLTGRRFTSSQTIRCPKCRKLHFIFPWSPSPFYRGIVNDSPPTEQTQTQPNARFWRKPLRAGGIALRLLLPGVIWLTQATFPPADFVVSNPFDGDWDRENRVRDARHALSEGLFNQAAEQFVLARKTAQPTERAALEHLEREARLMNDLLGESIPEILKQAEGVNVRAWQERFRTRYSHQAILFDTRVERTRDGYRLDYQLMLGENLIHIDFGEQDELAQLNWDEPHRLLFGFRLGESKQVRAGWVVVAEPHSVVLITEAALLKGASVPVDGELAQIIADQGRIVQKFR